jgi:hypothetical protein
VPFTFVGGSRDGTELTSALAPDEAFQKTGDGGWFKMGRGKASELYLRQDDGRLHYVKTMAPKNWRKSGDPCPVCESTETAGRGMASLPDEIICNIGGDHYILNGKRFALVWCSRCNGMVTVDLDEG